MPRTPNQLHLIFSPKSLPLAELIFYSKHLKETLNLKLGIHRNLLQTQAHLIVPKGIHADVRTTLVGQATILRFFSRLAAKPSIFQQHEIDQYVEELRVSNDNCGIQTKLLAKSDFLTIADCLAYQLLQSTNVSLPSYWAGFQETHVSWSRAQIKKALDTIATVDIFKFAVIEQLVEHAGVEVLDALKALAPLKTGSGAGVGVNIMLLKLGKPDEVAAKLLPKFKTSELITGVQRGGVFLNFSFSQDIFLQRAVTQALRQREMFGVNASGAGKFAICEFSSPNIAKPFHAGHLRSTIIGSFVQKLLDANGWETMSINYLGDWGKQYGLLAVGFEKYGSEAELEEDPIKHLYEVYVKINKDANGDGEIVADDTIHDAARAYFKNMEDGDVAALSLWKKFRDLSIVAYQKVYARLNVHFDLYSGESQYSFTQMKGVLDDLQEKKLLTPLDGALAVDLKEHGLGTAVIGKTDGTMLYLSRDIAAASHRFEEYDFDEMYYMVGAQQHHHFEQLFKILELQGKPWAGNCHHVPFGLIKSKDGNMSTRKGTVVFLQDILDHVKEEMHLVMRKNENKYAQILDPERVADVVGISSIMIQDMAARRIKDYAFDWARMLSFEGDTGPYLQYAHARLCSIQRGSEYTVDADNVQEYLHLLTEPHAHAVMTLVAHYPDLVRDLPASLEPCQVVMYALRLSHAVSSAYTVIWVHGQPKEFAMARLALYGAARVCLGNALKMLGLEPLERM